MKNKKITLTTKKILNAWGRAMEKDVNPLPSMTPRLNHFLTELGLSKLSSWEKIKTVSKERS